MPSPLGTFGTNANTGARGRGTEQFPDPFCDMASLAMPETMTDALRWCEYIAMANGPYRSALERVLSYFLTDIEIEGAGRDEKEKYKDFFNDTLGIKNVLRVVGLDYLVYGNSFTTVMMPFRRYLMCPHCGFESPISKVHGNPQFAFRWSGFTFNANCPHCAYSGKWNHIDRRSGEEGAIRIKRWSPHYMDILQDPFSDDVSYIWKIEEDYQRQITSGYLFHLERASWETIQAIKHGQALQFDKDVIYHMKEDALSGVRARGWGLSRVLTNFRQAWYVQVLHRYNEAIALDYVIPFRVLTPMPRAGDQHSSDPISSINMGGFVAKVDQMLRQRRQDPASWHTLPFPLQYQALGGDAKELAPHELMDQGLDTLLSAVGVPVELYKGNLSLQAAPAALRLFEATWSHLVHNLNAFLQNIADRLAKMLNWEPITCRLQRVTHADDLNRQMAKLQLMMGGQISQTTGLAALGLRFEEEQRRLLEEQQFVAEEQAKQQEQMDQAAQMDMVAPSPQVAPQDPAMAGGMPGGGMPAGGMPAGAAGGAGGIMAMNQQNPPNMPTTPEDQMQQAQMKAQELMGLPEAQKDSALIKLKQQDPVLHSLVQDAMEEMRNEARLVGGDQILAQQTGKVASSNASVISGRPLRRVIIDG